MIDQANTGCDGRKDAKVHGAFARTWVDVDTSALRRNIELLTPPTGVLLVMVKGNAYGHGTVEVARVALESGAQWLGVSFVSEGLELRAANVNAPILVTTEVTPGEELRAVEADLDLTIYSEGCVDRLSVAARRLGLTPRVHLKINTGLNRVGAQPDSAPGLARRAADAGLRIRGIWTHFAVAEELDNPASDVQLALLCETSARINLPNGASRPLLHAANTAAILARADTHLDMVRAGIGVYGYLSDRELPRADEFAPALSWRAMVSFVKRVDAGQGISYGFTAQTSRPTTIATVPVGFADGYPRCLSNRGEVLIGGRRHSITGTIAMDQMLIDCGDERVDVGDEVTLLGRQGSHTITADELAHLAHTISDEILCRIHPRVPRRYLR